MADGSGSCLQTPAEARQRKVSTESPCPALRRLTQAYFGHNTAASLNYAIHPELFLCSPHEHICWLLQYALLPELKKPALGGVCSVTPWEPLQNLRAVSLPVGHPALLVMYFEA